MKNYLLALFYFTLSALLTWLFVIFCPMYVSEDQMVLSTLIAGGKWGIQIGLGLLFLKEKAPLFLRKTGEVCLTGSLLLIPFIISAFFKISNSSIFFFLSLVVAVVVMIWYYYRSVKEMNLSLKWWFFWLICLAIAIALQLTWVFHYF